MWLREHFVAVALTLFLLAAGAISVLGVGNEGSPWTWDTAGVAPGVARGSTVLVVFLPLGGLVTATFRRVGIRTFGSFTPTLIALGLVGSPWTVWGLVFLVSLATAMTGRHLVGRLRVNRRVRLSLVMMILAATTAIVASLSARMGLGAPTGGVMLPMVALTLMVEHFHYDVDTKGLNDALQRLGSTLLVALVSFGAFSVLLAGDLALRYPGIAFGVAAALILVGLPPPGSTTSGAGPSGEDEAEQSAEEVAEGDTDGADEGAAAGDAA